MIDTSQLVAIQHAVGVEADHIRESMDPACRPATDAEWVVWLSAALGDLSSLVLLRRDVDEDSLVQLGAGVQLWLEDIVAESAR